MERKIANTSEDAGCYQLAQALQIMITIRGEPAKTSWLLPGKTNGDTSTHERDFSAMWIAPVATPIGANIGRGRSRDLRIKLFSQAGKITP